MVGLLPLKERCAYRDREDVAVVCASAGISDVHGGNMLRNFSRNDMPIERAFPAASFPESAAGGVRACGDPIGQRPQGRTAIARCQLCKPHGNARQSQIKAFNLGRGDETAFFFAHSQRKRRDRLSRRGQGWRFHRSKRGGAEGPAPLPERTPANFPHFRSGKRRRRLKSKVERPGRFRNRCHRSRCTFRAITERDRERNMAAYRFCVESD